mmetsp:Transcript_5207/g.12652  ORF Transcript_5207/g.12652 Transcript_5207/m.12652 type:complete len:335 (+) Transcript_5207:207-1211(+)
MPHTTRASTPSLASFLLVVLLAADLPDSAQAKKANLTVVVSRLPTNVSRTTLSKWCGRLGKVKAVEIQYSRRNTTALVTYRNRDRARKAVEELDGERFSGNAVQVAWYKCPSLDSPPTEGTSRRPNQVFYQINFAATGGVNRTRLRGLIVEQKGLLSNILHNGVKYLVADSKAMMANTQKVRRAQSWRIPIVSEDWIRDSISECKILPAEKYIPKKPNLAVPKRPTQSQLKNPKPQAAPHVHQDDLAEMMLRNTNRDAQTKSSPTPSKSRLLKQQKKKRLSVPKTTISSLVDSLTATKRKRIMSTKTASMLAEKAKLKMGKDRQQSRKKRRIDR